MVTRDCVIGRNTRWFGWTNPIRHMSHSHEPIKLDWGADGAEANQGVGGDSIGRKGGGEKKRRGDGGRRRGRELPYISALHPSMKERDRRVGTN